MISIDILSKSITGEFIHLTLKHLTCVFLHSERFMVRLNKNGGPKNPEKIDRLCALFTVILPPFTTRDLQNKTISKVDNNLCFLFRT